MKPQNDALWPSLPLQEWKDTYATLHLWTQIVGKIRASRTPVVNHFWNCTLYVSAHGLTTSLIPAESLNFEMEFDFIHHNLAIRADDGRTKAISLYPRSVADFYREVLSALTAMGIQTKIRAIPDEIPNPIPFAEDNTHASYDPEYANRLWRILVQINRVFQEFRAGFVGKCSPVHFFWGSFDLAVTRFSGRRAPVRDGADTITREAYSHEVSSAGFWPGSGSILAPAFYSYAAPAPEGYGKQQLLPSSAHYDNQMSEFILMYDDVRNSEFPEKTLMQFLSSTYEAAAETGKWDRKELER